MADKKTFEADTLAEASSPRLNIQIFEFTTKERSCIAARASMNSKHGE
jgi:hypothetical protein